MRVKRLLFAVLIPFTILPCGCSGRKTRSATYEFTKVRRGTLERTISSSGTIKPVSTVNVLPRMSGKVEKVFVDYNDTVQKGDILAELNTDMLRLKREQYYASVVKARANYELQVINYRTQAILAEKNLISEYELKTNKTSLDSQAADLAVAEANLKEVETEINQYAYITSPIDGIVLDRNINIGDTVVDSSSNNSTSIFTLAENLSEMQIEAGVGELDITSIHKGQTVRFTLESLPGRSFPGVVDTIRMVPVVSNNVVSYTVIINVENHDGSLMPGMTCAVDFIVERSEDVLMVSNAALRYQPSGLNADQISEMVFIAGLEDMSEDQRQAAIEAREQAQSSGSNQNQNTGGGITDLMMGGGQSGSRTGGGRQSSGRQGAQQGQARASRETIVMRNLWYMDDDGKPAVIRVRIGITNGSFTEIFSEDLEGKEVILRERI
ncbi:MAG: efflux RND transporter periplasmic adaptor subunit [Treponema sp.]|nr:efflux RND transporter periplasmic adaptor subunit [Treponema sp.]